MSKWIYSEDYVADLHVEIERLQKELSQAIAERDKAVDEAYENLGKRILRHLTGGAGSLIDEDSVRHIVFEAIRALKEKGT